MYNELNSAMNIPETDNVTKNHKKVNSKDNSVFGMKQIWPDLELTQMPRQFMSRRPAKLVMTYHCDLYLSAVCRARKSTIM